MASTSRGARWTPRGPRTGRSRGRSHERSTASSDRPRSQGLRQPSRPAQWVRLSIHAVNIAAPDGFRRTRTDSAAIHPAGEYAPLFAGTAGLQCGPELLLRAVLVEQRASDPVVSEALATKRMDSIRSRPPDPRRRRALQGRLADAALGRRRSCPTCLATVEPVAPALHRSRRARRQEPGQGGRRAQDPDRRLARPLPPATVQARRPAPARSCLGKLPLLSGRLTAPHGIEKPRQLPRTLCADPSAEREMSPPHTATGTARHRPAGRRLTNRPRSKRKRRAPRPALGTPPGASEISRA